VQSLKDEAATAAAAAAGGTADASSAAAAAAVARRMYAFNASLAILGCGALIHNFQQLIEEGVLNVFEPASSLALAIMRHMSAVLPLLSAQDIADEVYLTAADALPGIMLKIAKIAQYD
jgi:hypothetical protein